jgi:L-seryl-tRNA(Ser) seleniumtransferase
MWGGRSVFDSAIRLAGGTPVVVQTLDELRGALGQATAMAYTGYPADPDPVDPPPLADMLRICRAAGVPVFVDAAGGIPPFENLRRYSGMGVDLYAFSGGKGLCGPQCSGLLLGRRDLIEAALANTNPVEGAVCRALKVGKEEIIGCLAAVEKWRTVDLEALYAEQSRKLRRIAAMVETVAGVTTEIEVRRGSNRFMQLIVRWDEPAFGLSVEECARLLREGRPPISVLSNYNPYLIRIADLVPTQAPDYKTPRRGQPLVVYSLGLQSGEELIVGRRLREVLSSARQGRQRASRIGP